jgi:hypothetical protein
MTAIVVLLAGDLKYAAADGEDEREQGHADEVAHRGRLLVSLSCGKMSGNGAHAPRRRIGMVRQSPQLMGRIARGWG